MLLSCSTSTPKILTKNQVFKSKRVYNPKRLFGVTTLDVVRASKFISEIKGTDPANEEVIVVGGHSGVTIVPLLSQSNHPSIDGAIRDALVKRIQFGGDEVVEAKGGAGSATLSMAFAGSRMADSLLRASQGETGVFEPAFVESPLYKEYGCDFFSSKVELGPEGVKEIHPVGKVSLYEEKLIEVALKDLAANIKKVRPPDTSPAHAVTNPPARVRSSSRQTHKRAINGYLGVVTRFVLYVVVYFLMCFL